MWLLLALFFIYAASDVCAWDMQISLYIESGSFTKKGSCGPDCAYNQGCGKGCTRDEDREGDFRVEWKRSSPDASLKETSTKDDDNTPTWNEDLGWHGFSKVNKKYFSFCKALSLHF